MDPNFLGHPNSLLFPLPRSQDETLVLQQNMWTTLHGSPWKQSLRRKKTTKGLQELINSNLVTWSCNRKLFQNMLISKKTLLYLQTKQKNTSIKDNNWRNHFGSSISDNLKIMFVSQLTQHFNQIFKPHSGRFPVDEWKGNLPHIIGKAKHLQHLIRRMPGLQGMQQTPTPMGAGHLPVETCPKGAVDKKVGLKSYEPWKKPWLVGLYRGLYYPVIF